jgi:hypothetical protein
MTPSKIFLLLATVVAAAATVTTVVVVTRRNQDDTNSRLLKAAKKKKNSRRPKTPVETAPVVAPPTDTVWDRAEEAARCSLDGSGKDQVFDLEVDRALLDIIGRFNEKNHVA